MTYIVSEQQFGSLGYSTVFDSKESAMDYVLSRLADLVKRYMNDYSFEDFDDDDEPAISKESFEEFKTLETNYDIVKWARTEHFINGLCFPLYDTEFRVNPYLITAPLDKFKNNWIIVESSECPEMFSDEAKILVHRAYGTEDQIKKHLVDLAKQNRPRHSNHYKWIGGPETADDVTCKIAVYTAEDRYDGATFSYIAYPDATPLDLSDM